MKCEFNLCIYNCASKCSLNEIEINAYGMCDSCVLVNIPDTVIDQFKHDNSEDFILDDESDYIY